MGFRWQHHGRRNGLSVWRYGKPPVFAAVKRDPVLGDWDVYASEADPLKIYDYIYGRGGGGREAMHTVWFHRSFKDRASATEYLRNEVFPKVADAYIGA